MTRALLPLRLAWRELRQHPWRSAVATVLFALPIAAVIAWSSLFMAGAAAPQMSRTEVTVFSDPCSAESRFETCLQDSEADLASVPDLERILSAADQDIDADSVELSVRGVGTLRAESSSPAESGNGDEDTITAYPTIGTSAHVPSGMMEVDASYAEVLGLSDGDTALITAVWLAEPYSATIHVARQDGEIYSSPHDVGDVRVNLDELIDPARFRSADLPEYSWAQWNVPPGITYQGPGISVLSTDTTAAESAVTFPVLEILQYWSLEELIFMFFSGALGLVLIAGVVSPVFAISAQRQRRAMGLLALNGATRHHLRATLLWQGILTSAAGGLLGVVFGWGAVRLVALFLLPGYRLTVHWDVAILTVLAAAICGLLAAALPAHGAVSEKPIAALHGAVRSSLARLRPAAWCGPVLLVLGLLSWSSRIPFVFIPFIPLSVLCIGVGLLLSGPLVLALCSRLAGRGPLALRLASRALVRQTWRTSAAFAAMAGTVFVTMLMAWAPMTVDSSQVAQPRAHVVTPSVHLDRSDPLSGEVSDVARQLHASRMVEYYQSVLPGTAVVVGDENYFLAGLPEGEDESVIAVVRRELAQGRAVVEENTTPYPSSDPLLMPDDAAPSPDTVCGQRGCTTVTTVSLPTSAVSRVPSAIVMTKQTADSLGIDYYWGGTLIFPSEQLSYWEAYRFSLSQDLDGDTLLSAHLNDARFIRFLPNLVMPLLFCLLVTIGVVACITALSFFETRRDARLLSAMGASPRILRLLPALETSILAFLAALLSILTTMAMMLAGPYSMGTEGVNTAFRSFPWILVVLLLGGIPLLAGAVSTLVQRVGQRSALRAPAQR